MHIRHYRVMENISRVTEMKHFTLMGMWRSYRALWARGLTTVQKLLHPVTETVHCYGIQCSPGAARTSNSCFQNNWPRIIFLWSCMKGVALSVNLIDPYVALNQTHKDLSHKHISYS